MNYDKFLQNVSRRTGLSADRAEHLTRATLGTLAELLTADAAHNLAAQLPKPLHAALTKRDGLPEPMDVDEFLNRVWQRSGLPAEWITDGVSGVLTTVRLAVSTGEFMDMMAQLPREFAEFAPVPVR